VSPTAGRSKRHAFCTGHSNPSAARRIMLISDGLENQQQAGTAAAQSSEINGGFLHQYLTDTWCLASLTACCSAERSAADGAGRGAARSSSCALRRLTPLSRGRCAARSDCTAARGTAQDARALRNYTHTGPKVGRVSAQAAENTRPTSFAETTAASDRRPCVATVATQRSSHPSRGLCGSKGPRLASTKLLDSVCNRAPSPAGPHDARTPGIEGVRGPIRAAVPPRVEPLE
jgi:hypothetical protein